jgi:hypothetical protein
MRQLYDALLPTNPLPQVKATESRCRRDEIRMGKLLAETETDAEQSELEDDLKAFRSYALVCAGPIFAALIVAALCFGGEGGLADVKSAGHAGLNWGEAAGRLLPPAFRSTHPMTASSTARA